MKITRRAFIARTSAALAVKPGASPCQPTPAPKPAPAQGGPEQSRFRSLLARHDPVWEMPAETWQQGLPLGNGDLGVMVWGSGDPLFFTLDKTDLWEKRHWSPDPEHFKWREFRKLIESGTVATEEKAFQRPDGNPPPPYPTRLPVGRCELRPMGKLKSATMRLSLWTATASGELATDRGEIRWQALVHATEPLIILELDTGGSEAGAQFSASSFNDAKHGSKEVTTTLAAWGYPAPTQGKSGTASYWSQATPEGGEYAVAWRELAGAKGKRWILVSIAFTSKSAGAAAKACEVVRRFGCDDIPGLMASQQRWWAEYYAASFISIPDTRLESLYWMEMYKLASATRPDKPALALHGPWSEDGRMPPWSGDYHWNINMQMTYWPIYAANRLSFGEALYSMIDRARPRLREWCRRFLEREGEFLFHATDIDANPVYDWASGQFEFNGLAWVCHHYWLHWRYSQDRDFLRRRCLPLMKEAVRPYLDELVTKPDGELRLPWGFSPEYAGRDKGYWGPDNTCDLAFIRFLCQALLVGHRFLGTDDAERPRWEETLRKLTPYPTDGDNGLAVRADLPYETSHRHPSHLIPFYPLKILRRDDEAGGQLIDRSLRNWIYQGHGEWVGFSFAWGACLAANAGRPELARSLLLDYTDRFVTENSFHMQGPERGCDMSIHGTYALTLEAGFGAAAAMQEMLLESHGGLLRVFPAVPPAWAEAAFENLRAEGAFLVSAVRRQGKTEWVRIVSEAGGPCRVKTAFSVSKLKARSSTGPKSFQQEGDVLVFDTTPGEEIWVAPVAHEKLPAIEAVTGRPEEYHFFGVKKVARW